MLNYEQACIRPHYELKGTTYTSLPRLQLEAEFKSGKRGSVMCPLMVPITWSGQTSDAQESGPRMSTIPCGFSSLNGSLQIPLAPFGFESVLSTSEIPLHFDCPFLSPESVLRTSCPFTCNTFCPRTNYRAPFVP